MVHYHDDAGVFDGPVDKIWKLIQAHTPENISKIHPAYQRLNVLSQTANVIEGEFTIKTPEGTRIDRVRLNLNPPTSQTLEWLNGPMKESKCTFTYKQEGLRTRVVADGDMRIQGMDDASTKKIVTEFFDMAFNEDNTYLRTIT